MKDGEISISVSPERQNHQLNLAEVDSYQRGYRRRTLTSTLHCELLIKSGRKFAGLRAFLILMALFVLHSSHQNSLV